MTNPKCAVCGNISRLDAVACELCGTRFVVHGVTGRPFVDYVESVRPGALPTDIPSPRFLGVSDVVSPTQTVYRKHFVLVGKLVLATTLPLAILQLAAYALVPSDESLAAVTGAGVWGFAVANGVMGGLVYWLLSLFGNAVLSGALAYAVVELQRRGAAGEGDSLRWGLAKMSKVVAITLLSALMIYASPVVVLALMGSIFIPLAFIGVVLLILPWIILVVTISLAVPAATVEDRGVFESFRRSIELTRGFQGLLCLTYFLWWALIFALKLFITWSFTHGGALSLTGLVVQTLVEGMLNSSMTVLTLYIFLGILNERRQAAARAFAQAPAAPLS